ncbi:hypothetical protein [Actinomadura keratinilytica]
MIAILICRRPAHAGMAQHVALSALIKTGAAPRMLGGGFMLGAFCAVDAG